MGHLTVKTSKNKQVLDITELVEEELGKSDVKNGICHIFVLHTTACITTADLDPGTDLDLLDFLKEIVPKMDFRHPHNPAHTPDHLLSSIIGPSLSVPVENGQLVLGVWQRIILIELDGPRERELMVTLISS